jgi:hypothetical protein
VALPAKSLGLLLSGHLAHEIENVSRFLDRLIEQEVQVRDFPDPKALEQVTA